jgi:AcrR family transcriptional regulator
MARTATPSVPPTRDTREFAQERAQKTYDRLLQAAEKLFSERGYDDTQTPDIAEEAGVSVGTFYRYFADKRQAFIELITRYMDASFERIMKNMTAEAFGPTRTPSERRNAVEIVTEALFRSTAENPKLHRVFLAVSMRDPVVERIKVEFDDRGRAALAVLISQLVPRERIPNPEAAARVIQVAAQEVALANTGVKGFTPTKQEAADLRRALSDMLYRYAFGD